MEASKNGATVCKKTIGHGNRQASPLESQNPARHLLSTGGGDGSPIKVEKYVPIGTVRRKWPNLCKKEGP